MATDYLKKCHSLRASLSLFKCKLLSTRLLKLGGYSRILRHCDLDLSLEDRVARVHLPLSSSSDVQFCLNGQMFTCLPNESWYMNFNLPHEVENSSERPRIHLVVDCEVNDWLTEQVLCGECYFSDDGFQLKNTTTG